MADGQSGAAPEDEVHVAVDLRAMDEDARDLAARGLEVEGVLEAQEAHVVEMHLVRAVDLHRDRLVLPVLVAHAPFVGVLEGEVARLEARAANPRDR